MEGAGENMVGGRRVRGLAGEGARWMPQGLGEREQKQKELERTEYLESKHSMNYA